jgi:hypothetical protein
MMASTQPVHYLRVRFDNIFEPTPTKNELMFTRAFYIHIL